MAEWLLRKKLFESNLDQTLRNSSQPQIIDERSPLLRDLQHSEHQRVKKLSHLFEKKTSTFNLRTNWWLDESASGSAKNEHKIPMKQEDDEDDDGWPVALSEFAMSTPMQPLSMKPRLSLSRSLNDLVSMRSDKSSRKISLIVDELLKKEQTYMQSLKRGIDNYVKVIDEGGSNVPKRLRHQTFSMFGNIKEIYQLHATSVYPRLSICGGSVQLIAETLSSLVLNDCFYCYIVYAINQKSAEQIISANQRFFEKLCIKNNDNLGINSFVILPVQKLPHYRLFLEAIIKELVKSHPVVDKDALTACRAAEQHVSALLRRLNEALLINDIVETHEFPASVQLGFITSVQEQIGFQSGDKPLLFIVPRERSSSDYDFKSLLNIMDLGKFMRCSVFKITELNTRKSFPGKVFVFEKCLLYTRIIGSHGSNALSYRHHFNFVSNFAFLTNEDQMSIRITDTMQKRHDIRMSSQTLEIVVEMKKLINQFYDPRRSNDSAFVDVHELMISEELTDDEDDEDAADGELARSGWVTNVASELASANTTLNETVHIANSRFYIQSPTPPGE